MHVPRTLTGSHLLAMLKKLFNISEKKNNHASTMFLFAEKTLIMPTDKLGDIYNKLMNVMPKNTLVISYS